MLKQRTLAVPFSMPRRGVASEAIRGEAMPKIPNTLISFHSKLKGDTLVCIMYERRN